MRWASGPEPAADGVFSCLWRGRMDREPIEEDARASDLDRFEATGFVGWLIQAAAATVIGVAPWTSYIGFSSLMDLRPRDFNEQMMTDYAVPMLIGGAAAGLGALIAVLAARTGNGRGLAADGPAGARSAVRHGLRAGRGRGGRLREVAAPSLKEPTTISSRHGCVALTRHPEIPILTPRGRCGRGVPVCGRHGPRSPRRGRTRRFCR